MTPYQAGILRQIAEFGIDHVLGFLTTYEESYESDLALLNKRAKTGDEDEDHLADEKYLLDQILTLALQLGAVALYRVVEINMKKILTWRWSAASIKAQKLYNADRLRAALRRELGVNIRQLPGFETIDELRCANNAVKHEGKVSQALAAHAGWTVGEPLNPDSLKPLLDRAQLVIPTFVHAFAEAVVPKAKPRILEE
jgi:hypothetical protein